MSDAPAAQPRQICTGCGSTQTIEQIKAEHPTALSCCPERRMVDREAYEAGRIEGRAEMRSIAADLLLEQTGHSNQYWALALIDRCAAKEGSRAAASQP